MPFCRARHRLPGQQSTRSCLVKYYEQENEALSGFLETLLECSNPNVIEAYGVVKDNKISRKAIVFEKVSCSLRSYLEEEGARLKTFKKVDEQSTDLSARGICLLRAVATSVSRIHKKGKAHGKLSLDDIYLAADDHYPDTHPLHLKVKLTLPDHEVNTEAMKNVSHTRDWVHIGGVIAELTTIIGLRNHPEADRLVKGLKDCRITSLEAFLEEPFVWFAYQKRSTYLNVVESCRIFQFERVFDSWTDNFEDIISKMPKPKNAPANDPVMPVNDPEVISDKKGKSVISQSSSSPQGGHVTGKFRGTFAQTSGNSAAAQFKNLSIGKLRGAFPQTYSDSVAVQPKNHIAPETNDGSIWKETHEYKDTFFGFNNLFRNLLTHFDRFNMKKAKKEALDDKDECLRLFEGQCPTLFIQLIEIANSNKHSEAVLKKEFLHIRNT